MEMSHQPKHADEISASEPRSVIDEILGGKGRESLDREHDHGRAALRRRREPGTLKAALRDLLSE